MGLIISKLRAILAASILVIALATPAMAWYAISVPPNIGQLIRAAYVAAEAANPTRISEGFNWWRGRGWFRWWAVSGWWGGHADIQYLTSENSANTCYRFLFPNLTPTLNDYIEDTAAERFASEQTRTLIRQRRENLMAGRPVTLAQANAYALIHTLPIPVAPQKGSPVMQMRASLVDDCADGDIPVNYNGGSIGQGIAYISEYSKSRELDLAASLLPRSIAEFSPRLRFVTEDGHFAFSMQRFGLTMEHKFVGDSGITSLQFNRKFGKNKQHLFQLNGELDRSHTDLNLSDYGLGTLYLDPQYSVNARVQFRW